MHLSLDHVNLRFESAAGHVHRVGPISQKAMELLRLRLRNELLGSAMSLDDLYAPSLSIQATGVNLAAMSDEAAAEKLADAMFLALRARWQEG